MRWPRLYLRTFGCQMNEYDSDKMADVLRAADGLRADRATRGRRRDPVQHLLGAREGAGEGVRRPRPREAPQARASPDLLIGVGGCVASQEGAAIVERAPYVDLVFGPQTLHRLPRADRARAARPASRRSTSAFPRSRSSTTCRRRASRARRAFVSIMEGCSKYCSFCVVPYTRGEEVSRPFDDVLAEVAGLADQGVQRSHAARPERQRLPRARWATARSPTSRMLLEYVARDRRASSASATRPRTRANSRSALIDAYARRAASSRSHLHLPVQSRLATACSRR